MTISRWFSVAGLLTISLCLLSSAAASDDSLAAQLIAKGEADKDPFKVILAAHLLERKGNLTKDEKTALLDLAMDLKPEDNLASQATEASRLVPTFGAVAATNNAIGAVGDDPGDTGSQPTSALDASGPLVLPVGLLIFAALVIGMQVWVMLKQDRYWDNMSMKIVGLSLVLTSGLLLIVAGYSQDQIAPMMGLLGTVAGYLLGKDNEDEEGGGQGNNELFQAAATAVLQQATTPTQQVDEDFEEEEETRSVPVKKKRRRTTRTTKKPDA